MKKSLLFLLILLVLIYPGNAQLKKGQIDLSSIPVPQGHYWQEYTYEVKLDTLSWIKQKSGLHAAFGSIDELYLRNEIPQLNEESINWKGTGWKGERLNAQVLVWSPDTIEQIHFRVSDLYSPAGKIISRDNISLNMVRYVVSNYPYGATKFDCGSRTDSAWLVPDRFESFERFNLPGRSVRPVWINFDIPQKAEPGEYSGTIETISLKEKITSKIKIIVQNQVLPDPHDWKFRLDLWQNPWVVAWYFKVEPWSDVHKALLKKHLKLYADAGGKYITTYIVHSPWADNSYMIEETMIDWIKTINDSWKFDYSIFDQYVELAIEAGIDEAITIYTPVPFGYRFRYMDEKSGNYIYEEWDPSSAQFKTFWNLLLNDLKAHLIQKGWFNKTYLGLNENPLDITKTAVRIIKENSKEWKITYAGDWYKELSPLLDDYSSVISHEPGPEEIRERSSMGRTTTFYVCCTPPQPNNFVFSTPVEGRYISWHALAYGYNGFLRWAYDAWPADPVRDARHSLWPAGDCFLVYPGGNSCIRFEKLREGIADYEKLLILRTLASKSANNKVKSLMQALEAHLATFIEKGDYSGRVHDIVKMTEAVQKGNQLIRDLSDELEH